MAGSGGDRRGGKAGALQFTVKILVYTKGNGKVLACRVGEITPDDVASAQCRCPGSSAQLVGPLHFQEMTTRGRWGLVTSPAPLEPGLSGKASLA